MDARHVDYCRQYYSNNRLLFDVGHLLEHVEVLDADERGEGYGHYRHKRITKQYTSQEHNYTCLYYTKNYVRKVNQK